MITNLMNPLFWQMSKSDRPTKTRSSRHQTSHVNLAIDHLEDRTVCDIGLGWAAVIGSAGFKDHIRDHVVDSLGNLYVIGTFEQSIDVDPGAGVTTLVSSADSDGFIAKYSADGRSVWAGTFGGSVLGGDESACSIEITDTGRIFVLGQFTDMVDANPSPYSGYFFNGKPNSDNLFLAEIDSNGNFKKGNAILAGEFDTVYAGDLEFDHLNNRLIVTGTLDGQATFGTDADSPSQSSVQTNVFVASFGTDLKPIWAKTLPGNGIQLAEGLVVNNGSIYISGNFYEAIDLNPNAGIYTLVSSGLTDIFVVKLTSAGNFSSGFQIGGSGFDIVANIEIDSSSNLYIGGLFSNTVDFDPVLQHSRWRVMDQNTMPSS